ncbi:hypothetical protein BDN71DRAFT_1456063 [Pleurotus eryngii]|uniref:Uncharacterized protein n=1 Tax=Pleurotus eryngii TaxID=5323 RepID=A0A9P5ZPF5_PLEER|nr:hypothetical protein BDN71DRAFT_1456063 [Pleurotus eryngii]
MSGDDEETGIDTMYNLFVEAVQVDPNDRWSPGATVSLYQWRTWMPTKRDLLYMQDDHTTALQWRPHQPQPLCWSSCIVIEYTNDGHTQEEEVATWEEAEELASRAEYDRWDKAHLEVTRTVSSGTSTVWVKVERDQWYNLHSGFEIRVCLEFANAKDCTQFIQEEIDELEGRDIISKFNDGGTVAINDIIQTVAPIADDFRSALTHAARRHECTQPETKLIRRRASSRDLGRPCYLTLHLSTIADTLSDEVPFIAEVNWSATTIPPIFPLHASTFRSLNNLHLKFHSVTSQDGNYNSPSRSQQDDLTISVSAREISLFNGTNSVFAGNSFSVNSEDRTVNINYINTIMGDAFLGPISGGNNGGRNNVNTIRMMSPVESRSSRVSGSPSGRQTQVLNEQAALQAGVGRWVRQRSPRPRPY